ncbi:hypothetical protein JTB14_028280 [Gonioctena quinquepunctata]|nr:hypothetical protein JTB14_028280 [Gonioctena quinquepunctata]
MMEDYEILNILSNTTSTTKTFKTKHKISKELFVLKELDNEQLKKIKWETLQEKIISRMSLQHPNLLEFQSSIEDESGSYFVVTQYCKHGSLKDIIKFCRKHKKMLSEEFICRILYQICSTIKEIGGYVGKLQPNEVFFEDDFNVKLYNFGLGGKIIVPPPRMFLLGELLFQACTLSENINNFHKESQTLSRFYSESLVRLIFDLERNQGKITENISMILRHPTLLLKSAEWDETNCFMQSDEMPSQMNSVPDAELNDFEKLLLQIREKKNNTPSRIPTSLLKSKYSMPFDETLTIPTTNYSIMGMSRVSVAKAKFTDLKEKQMLLQAREKELEEWEQRLAVREKKITLMEKSAEEKLQQAELYLKSSSNESCTNSSSKVELIQ